VHWQANPSIASNLVWDASGAFKVNHDALVIVSCGVNAEAGTVGVHGAGKLVLTTSDPAFPTGEWGTDFVFDTFTTSGATVLNAITTPLLVHLNSLLGMNLIFDIGSVGTLKVHKIFFSVEILALQ
jgi:hypothetical protein